MKKSVIYILSLILSLMVNQQSFGMQLAARAQRLFGTERTRFAARAHLINSLTRELGERICPCSRMDELAALTLQFNDSELKKVIENAAEHAKNEKAICNLKKFYLNADMLKRAILSMNQK